MTGMRPLARGDIVLVPFPFTDLSSSKLRPAGVLHIHPARGDATLAFIGSQDVSRISPGEMSLLPGHPEFPQTGLAVASKIHATKLVTLSRTLLTRRFGQLGPLLMAGLDSTLLAGLSIDPAPLEAEAR